MIKRINRACAYFPCHKGLEDCTFCYCPFYHCEDKKRGNYIYSPKLKKNIWSCQECSWIHKKKTVDAIFRLIQNASYLIKPNLQIQKSRGIGIIILGHGSKLKRANETILDTVKTVKNEGWKIVEPAYLQFCQPGPAKSIANAVKKRCKKLIIVPFFLCTGNHVTRDIPKAIKKEAAKYPKVDFIYANNLGEDRRIQKIVLDRIAEAVTKCAQSLTREK